jgi:HD-GYP domain-containing protein (c-di-GMP phosphodiesterase class II)
MLGGLTLAHAAYTDLHPLLVAVISELIGRRLGLDEVLRGAMCCAALSSNLGMLDLQDTLSRQQSPLDEGQRRAVLDHPEQSFEILRSAGVTDPLWLDIVLHHHERSDGSGYPHGRAAPQLEHLISIVALADNYAAMVLPRTYREGLHAQQAMREIFVQRRLRVADELAQQFVKELGVYPPGAFVTMKNGDVGLVIRRGQHAANAPVVSCFANAGGVPYSSPLLHDTSEAGATVIAGIAAPSELPLPLTRLWGMER